MKLEWLYFKQQVSPVPGESNIIQVNPHGNVGVLTCWNYASQAYKGFTEAGIDLSPATSPIVAISSFYGRGIGRFVRNILYNPQIDRLLILGADLSGAGKFLESLLDGSAARIVREGESYWQDKETGQVVLADFPLHILQKRITLLRLGDKNKKGIHVAPPNHPLTLAKAKQFVGNSDTLKRGKRINVKLKEINLEKRPGLFCDSLMVTDTVEDAFKLLVRRVMRHGEDSVDEKGVARRALFGVKVTIKDPKLMNLEDLEKLGQPKTTIRMPPALLMKEAPADSIAYFYGHRLRKHFGKDQVDEAVRNLKTNRFANLQVWDDEIDKDSKQAKPCLLWIQLKQGPFMQLNLECEFRVHNLADAWLTNTHDLILFLQHMSQETGLCMGSVTIKSNRLSIRTEDKDHLSHMGKMVSDLKIDSQMRISHPKPTLNIVQMDGYLEGILFTGKEVLLETGQSRKEVLHKLYKAATGTEGPNPCKTLADALECGRLLELALKDKPV